MALSMSMRELLPMRELLQEVGEQLKLDFAKPSQMHSTVFEDNNGAMGLATSPKIMPQTKHIAIKYHFSRIILELRMAKELRYRKLTQSFRKLIFY